MDIREYLKSNVLIMDGAMGTYYDKKSNHGEEIAERANLTNPDLIKEIHKEYIKSGANMIRTNTFAANHHFFKNRKEIEENIKAAYQLAEQAVEEAGKDTYIAASIGPIPTKAEEEDNTSAKEYQMICDCFLQAGCRIFVFETFSSIDEIAEAAEYLRSKMGNDCFIIGQFILNPTGYTKDGISLKRLAKESSKMEALDAYGFNCGIGAAHLYELLAQMEFPSDKYITALPNSGYPHVVRGRTIYSDSPSYFVEKMSGIVELGVNIVGGCCGTTPAYIKELTARILDRSKRKKKIRSFAASDSVKAKIQNPFMEKLLKGEKVIAVELDPPFHEDASKLINGSRILKDQQVDMITIADSPLARSRADSIHMGIKLIHDIEADVMPHICCRDKNAIAMRAQLLGAYINGMRNLLVITGDPIGRGDRDTIKSVFDFNSIKLMNYIKEMNTEHFLEDPISYGGALNYNGANPDKIIERMKRKIDAGCEYFLTQPIYSNEDIERIHYIKERVDTKILCGIMPLVSYKNASFIKNEMPGIHVPDEIIKRYREDMSREEAEAVAIDVCRQVAAKLYQFADGFYLMTPFNRVGLISRIVEQIRGL